MYVCLYVHCRASHGGAIRVMYSIVIAGVVHVLDAWAQGQSTVWCSFHTAACNTSFCRVCVLLVFLDFLFSLFFVLLLLLATHLIFAFLWAPENRHIGGVFALFDSWSKKKHRKYRCFLPLVAKVTVFTKVFGLRLAKTRVFTQFSACRKKMQEEFPKAQKH